MSRAWLAAVAVIGVAAAPLSAATYTITLTNGGTFESAYQPVDGPGAVPQILFYDEIGNLIVLDKAMVANVESDVEKSGYGKVIDSTTMILGVAPNDLDEAQADQLAAQQGQPAFPQGQVAPSGNSEPIYEPDAIPPTMQVLPPAYAGGEPYVVPAPAPAPVEPPSQ